MAEGRIFKKNLEIRLKTVEDQLDDIFGRIRLLDEQARQAAYRAWLATEPGAPTRPAARRDDRAKPGTTRKLAELKAAVRDNHDERIIASRRPAHTSR